MRGILKAMNCELIVLGGSGILGMSVVTVINLAKNTTTELTQGDAYFFRAYLMTLSGVQDYIE
jgi:hypothetical protein